MTRLNPEPPSAVEMHAVITTAQLKHAAKAVRMLLRVTFAPQIQKAVACALHMDEGTASPAW
ncbi:hypothetical protein [Streptomyces nodosus]|uniref:hypothetical protein n=1 Tax=Streptomyces nodosus TaxID=40318 RepID=UPI003823E7F5